MGWLVMAVGLTILIITGSYQNQKMSETTNAQQYASAWICPYISRHLLSLNPLQARCRRYSRGER